MYQNYLLIGLTSYLLIWIVFSVFFMRSFCTYRELRKPKSDHVHLGFSYLISIVVPQKNGPGGHGRPQAATGGHGRPRAAQGGHGQPRAATGGNRRPRAATGGHGRPRAVTGRHVKENRRNPRWGGPLSGGPLVA